MNEKAVEAQDWRLRVFDSLSFPTLILRPDRVIVTANEKLLDKFGVPMKDIVGKTCHEVFYNSKEPCSAYLCPLPGVLAIGEGHSILREVTLSTGEKAWEDRVFSPIKDDAGKIIYVMESLRDVTRIKTLERTLEETREFLEKVIQSSASAIVAADLDGNILIMNRAAEALFGFSIREAKGKKSVIDLYPPGKAKELMREMRKGKRGGKGKLPLTKVNILNVKGEVIPVEVTASIIYEQKKEVATMGIYNDLRDKLAVEKALKETQAQLSQSEKMASLGQLAAGVAHEVNNPLTGILLYASMALEQMDKDDPMREHLGYIVEDVNRCKGIVKNLLAYSRRSTTTREIIPLNDLVHQSLNLIRDQKLFGNIVVVKELSEEMMMVHADKNQLAQVLINLILNACAAMSGEGVLTFRTYRDKPNKLAYLEVKDNGCGIAEENLPKIFDPFFTTKEPGKGTGLGLSTSLGIIQESGGRLSVRETGPQGTTFVVELPLFVPEEDPEHSLPPDGLNGERTTDT
ncbi:MAG: sensor signal transduction histidine kinase [Deltaproteobacteria bacterium]|jgi:PAS domain S-box-containing protein|nr:sensor signal transduction histidine kinase [Deltaproteobacteria bacterium]